MVGSKGVRISILILVLSISVRATETSPNLAGRWDVRIQMLRRVIKGTLVLQKDGGRVTGTWKREQPSIPERDVNGEELLQTGQSLIETLTQESMIDPTKVSLT